MNAIGEHVPHVDALVLYEKFRAHVAVDEDLCAFFRRSFLEERKWRAVAISEEMSPSEAIDVASACAKHGYSRAWTMDINRLDRNSCFRISLDAETLVSLKNVFLTPSHLVVEEAERFMMLSDSDYYWTIAGPPSFLTDVFQTELDLLDQNFVEAMQDYRDSGSPVRRTLSRIAVDAIDRSERSVRSRQ